MLKRILLCALVCVFSIFTALAQCDEVPNPGTPDDPGYDPNGCPVPLDTWVALLVAVAIIYGLIQINKNQKLSG